MRSNTCLFCLLTLFSLVSSYVVPIQRIRISSPSPREKFVGRRSRFVMRQEHQPSTLVTSIAAGSVPTHSTTQTFTPTSTACTSSSSPSTTPTTLSSKLPPLPSTTESIPQPSQLPAATDGPRKYVVAHHMVGNTFPYTLDDWKEDIVLAHAAGIDGFALNMGTDSWEPARVADAYDAAKQSGLDFKLFLSLDMSSFPCNSPTDARTLRNLVNTYISHPNQLQYASRAFVSTFSGENCKFGQGSVPDGWKSQFSKHPDLDGKIYFVPAFFIDPASFTDFADVMDGDFNWNSGWPVQVTTSFAQKVLSSISGTINESHKSLLSLVTHATAAAGSVETKLGAEVNSTLTQMQLALSKFIGATETDKQHLDSLAALPGTLQARDGELSKRAYMGAVSPWFFTHYGADSFNKNFVFLSDQHLYSKRWESIINLRDQFDIVQVLTWNDYGESDYIGPIKGAQPNSQAWTDGMNHTAWLDLTQYYATAFKTGEYPAIEKDKIVIWSRPHSTRAKTSDPVPQPTNFELFEDAIWAVVLTTAPSNVTLSTSPTTSKTFQVPAGLSKLALPITPGGIMKGTIERNGQTIVELNPNEFTFQGSPTTYNFNAFVASATAD
ncbi:glycoside hydrolase family 71 protein [Phlegmacium glaucopus]|nr:glycoside hydrolase family 71 protein [Phlegmacium glaucopus]